MRIARLLTEDLGVVLCAVDQNGVDPQVLWDESNQQPYSVIQDLLALSAEELNALTRRPLAASGKLLAPVIPDRNVICVGRNYAEHAEEFARSGFDATQSTGASTPDHPVVFTKPAFSIIGPEDAIDAHSDLTDALDYEGEIGIIISKPAYKVSREEALDYVWGYTLINDVTARDLQRDHKQWFIGKSLDTFCPIGPWIATADEVDSTNIGLQTLVNGEVRQDSNTSLLIFDIPTIIETLTAGITLQAGDVIATGTPKGVGIGFDPPKYLQQGDEVVVRGTGLGELRNPIAVSPAVSNRHVEEVVAP